MDDRAARGGARASGSGRDASDRTELHFLLLHYLRSLPTADAADAFEREATAHGLLPRRPDPFGREHAQTYEEMRAMKANEVEVLRSHNALREHLLVLQAGVL